MFCTIFYIWNIIIKKREIQVARLIHERGLTRLIYLIIVIEKGRRKPRY
jgi:hypothetical protein